MAFSFTFSFSECNQLENQDCTCACGERKFKEIQIQGNFVFSAFFKEFLPGNFENT
jgi:hypothetical protein